MRVSEQNDLSRPPVRVIALPVVRYEIPLDVAPKVTVTVVAVVQVQVDKEAPMKVNRVLHSQVAVTMRAESVGVSNVITTAWPLSEN